MKNKSKPLTAFIVCLSAAAVFTSCAQSGSNVTDPNVNVLSDENSSAYAVPDTELKLNDGNFYFTGDTAGCYYTIRDGTVMFHTEEQERMKYYYYVGIADYYYLSRAEGLSPGPQREGFDEWYDRECDMWTEPRTYEIYEDDILGTLLILSGGDSFDYIDENNFGMLSSKRGGIDMIFTRVPDDAEDETN